MKRAIINVGEAHRKASENANFYQVLVGTFSNTQAWRQGSKQLSHEFAQTNIHTITLKYIIFIYINPNWVSIGEASEQIV